MVALVLSALIALLHFWIMALETLFWDRPLGRKTFRMTPEQAAATRTLALNQGVYNGFLAAGLAWGVYTGLPGGAGILVFFLACVAIAGIVGAATVSSRILIVQTVPALLALGALAAGL